ncbi:rhodanese-like domain-containing protein [Alkalilimnicola ehrlichii MLHE-1]|uniref:Rhodanese domain protein n=1 Tax=Alkalilimnicola ehrlichii (strain ATCC BAA-1101 / DSM 17681 / MLHE-1) TaxID=187272 RepID=Q0A513_ALKEH|nr:rhodanese-like domain-containing protein [Alkalilimnicola ehrlichii]ABI58074.1 Rhodanese domain protein [Alkalilimnicola ehrlichii MLHE-1]
MVCNSRHHREGKGWRRSGTVPALVVCGLLLSGLLIPGVAATVDDADDPIWHHPHINAEGYRYARYRAATPDSVPEGETVDTGRAQALWAAGEVVAIDVMPVLERKGPDGKPEWVVLEERRHIPGSIWLPNVGAGRLSPEMEAWFADALAELTAGDSNQPLLFYCITDCWMAWNAVRRAAALGYTSLYWYPPGADGWQRAGLPTEPAQPKPRH